MQKLVLFDVDGTLLIASSSANSGASRKMFKKVFGIDANEEMIDNVGKTEMQIIKEVIKLVTKKDISEVPQDAYKVWGEETAKALENEPVTLLAGVTDLLMGLQEKGVPFGLLTGGNIYRAKAKLTSAGILDYFSDSDEPKGAFGNLALRREDLVDIAKIRMGYEKEAIAIIIDDSLFVAKMITRLNLPHVMVATGTVSFEELKQYVPHVVPSFSNGGWQEVIRIIEQY